MSRNPASAPRLMLGPSLLVLLAPAALLTGCGRTALDYVQEARTARTLDERQRLLSRALEKEPGLKDARLSRAWVYALQKKNDLAMADYDVLRQNSQVPEELAVIYYWRGQALELAANYPDAVDSYSAALRIDRFFLTPIPARAAAFFKMGKYLESMEDYKTMLSRDIDREGEEAAERRSDLYLRRAIAAFCAGEWSAAAADFRQAIDRTRAHARKATALLNLYFVACKLGNKKKADELLNAYATETLNQFGPSQRATPWVLTAIWFTAGLITEQQFLDGAKHSNPDVEADRSTAAHYYVAARLLANGETDKALDTFKKAVARKLPESLEFHMATVELDRIVGGGRTAGDFVAMAKKVETHEKKIELYTEALRIDPNHTDARLNRALLYSLIAKHDLAIDDYTKLLEQYKRPANRATALHYRGVAYAQKGDHLSAVKDYEAATQADPDLWQAREGLANSLAHLRKYKEAAAIYAELTKNPAVRSLHHFWSLERAFALACLGDWKGAALDFAAVARNVPDAPIVYANLYIAECKSDGRGAAAKRLNDFAARLKTTSWESTVAWYLAEMQDLKDLVKACEHADKDTLLLRTSRAYYYIGALHLIKSRTDDARSAFQKCVELSKQSGRETWEFRMALAELERKDQWK